MIEQPKHWSHTVSTATVLTLPVVQCLAYVTYGTATAFALPLAVAAPVLLTILIMRPRAKFRQAPDHRAWARNGSLLTAALIVAFFMVPTGEVLVLRGFLIDALALFAVGYTMRVHQARTLGFAA